MKPGVIDLAELKLRADERESALEQIAADRAAVEAVKWDRAMRRTFKGIFPRREAHAFLRRAQPDA